MFVASLGMSPTVKKKRDDIQLIINGSMDESGAAIGVTSFDASPILQGGGHEVSRALRYCAKKRFWQIIATRFRYTIDVEALAECAGPQRKRRLFFGLPKEAWIGEDNLSSSLFPGEERE